MRRDVPLVGPRAWHRPAARAAALPVRPQDRRGDRGGRAAAHPRAAPPGGPRRPGGARGRAGSGRGGRAARALVAQRRAIRPARAPEPRRAAPVAPARRAGARRHLPPRRAARGPERARRDDRALRGREPAPARLPRPGDGGLQPAQRGGAPVVHHHHQHREAAVVPGELPGGAPRRSVARARLAAVPAPAPGALQHPDPGDRVTGLPRPRPARDPERRGGVARQRLHRLLPHQLRPQSATGSRWRT